MNILPAGFKNTSEIKQGLNECCPNKYHLNYCEFANQRQNSVSKQTTQNSMQLYTSLFWILYIRWKSLRTVSPLFENLTKNTAEGNMSPVIIWMLNLLFFIPSFILSFFHSTMDFAFVWVVGHQWNQDKNRWIFCGYEYMYVCLCTFYRCICVYI